MKKSDEPAYPLEVKIPAIFNSDNPQFIHTGLTKREYFAGLAMQGILSDDATETLPKNIDMEKALAKFSVLCADALLAELDKGE